MVSVMDSQGKKELFVSMVGELFFCAYIHTDRSVCMGCDGAFKFYENRIFNIGDKKRGG